MVGTIMMAEAQFPNSIPTASAPLLIPVPS